MNDLWLRAYIEWSTLPWYARISLGFNALIVAAFGVALSQPLPTCQ